MVIESSYSDGFESCKECFVHVVTKKYYDQLLQVEMRMMDHWASENDFTLDMI